MDTKIKRFIDYIPEWNKNKEDDVPIVAELKYMTTSEFDDCYDITPQIINEKGKKIGGGNITVNKKKMFLFVVKAFKNFTITDEKDKQVEINTGQDVLDNPGLEDLFLEIVTFIRGMEARVDLKNKSLPFAGCSKDKRKKLKMV